SRRATPPEMATDPRAEPGATNTKRTSKHERLSPGLAASRSARLWDDGRVGLSFLAAAAEADRDRLRLHRHRTYRARPRDCLVDVSGVRGAGADADRADANVMRGRGGEDARRRRPR